MNDILFSSENMTWETPQWLFNELNKTYHFKLDVAASKDNTKCKKYYDKEMNGLLLPWVPGPCWCNPPYGREIYKWVEKASHETQINNTVTVMLIPARTDTKYFHDFIYNRYEVIFLKGRLKFSNSTNSAPFPSMLVLFKKKIHLLRDYKKSYERLKGDNNGRVI